jgi:hypothetical protein
VRRKSPGILDSARATRRILVCRALEGASRASSTHAQRPWPRGASGGGTKLRDIPRGVPDEVCETGSFCLPPSYLPLVLSAVRRARAAVEEEPFAAQETFTPRLGSTCPWQLGWMLNGRFHLVRVVVSARRTWRWPSRDWIVDG